MVFFVILALYFLTKKDNKKKTGIFLAGMMCFISFTIKGTFLLILPSIILGFFFYSFFQHKKKMKIPFSSIILLCLGMAVVLVFWLCFFYFPHKEMFLSYGIENYNWLIPQGFIEALKNFCSSVFYTISTTQKQFINQIKCLSSSTPFFSSGSSSR